MKRAFALMTVLAALLLCGCGGTSDPDPEPVKDWQNTFNGELVLALSDAYSVWEEDNALPTAVTWEGVRVFTSEFVRAGITLLLNMIDDPDGWFEDDVVYPNATFGLSSFDEPFLPCEIPFAAFEQLLRNLATGMVEDKQIPATLMIPGYDSMLSTTGLAVMLCRSFAAYVKDGKFPESIYTWESSYLHQTSHMDLSSQIIKDARDAAWKKAGVTETSTVREKAVAIFNYAREEWTWEDYSNTRKGAEGTITAKGGNCCDLSNAIVAMSRISGIPARYFHAQCHYSSGYIGHVISQLFVEGEWVMADASNDSNSFGTVVFTDYTSLHYYEDLYF